MDNKKNVEIKKEETNEALIEHISLYLDNPLRIEKTSVHVKEEPEQKWDRDSSEHNLLEDPLMISWSTDCIKEDPELILGVDGTEDIFGLFRKVLTSIITFLLQRISYVCNFFSLSATYVTSSAYQLRMWLLLPKISNIFTQWQRPQP
ncbi:uncharacterized protein LOC126427294 isoform X1 [Schistocerca serialis cubense]|uniref:uncharacterized protein LOC126427294 isoform X1 n=1 Tax=Schistocerca serialis cubense TaxID=2023355 RepID=UPI00214EEAC9|nr:uncharacterized protein LOC126427294 isoform X1 [Schistocerca serialis cubense]XP_049945544.1 uncharacterized protein LOC126427294 isoform X1 [Schistocerca serialis cubense]